MAEPRTDQVSFGWTTEVSEASREPRAPVAQESSPWKAKGSKAARSARALKATPASESETELPPDNELWDVHAAARFLKRSVSWVYHRAEDGTLPVRRLGGWGIRFIPGELRAWVESGDAGRRR